MKNKPAPALLGGSYLFNEIKKRPLKSRETIPLMSLIQSVSEIASYFFLHYLLRLGVGSTVFCIDRRIKKLIDFYFNMHIYSTLAKTDYYDFPLNG
jgi:hypothetical protein